MILFDDGLPAVPRNRTGAFPQATGYIAALKKRATGARMPIAALAFLT